VLAHILTTLNERHSYGLDLFLLSIDEGITGYRDDSLETVKRNEQQYGIPLKILSYKELYGWTMDEIVRAIGHKNNCTFCGVFRRQALDRGAALMKADKMATGAQSHLPTYGFPDSGCQYFNMCASMLGIGGRAGVYFTFPVSDTLPSTGFKCLLTGSQTQIHRANLPCWP